MWYVMRHGQTFSNANKIMQGRSESLLSLKGIDQSKSIAYRLLDTGEDFSKYRFICSPMVRTRHTINIVMEILGIDPFKAEIEPLVQSRSKGIFENMPKENVKKLYPEEMEKKEADKWNYAPPGGESKEEMYQKLLKFIEKNKNKKNIVLTLHNTGVCLIKAILQGNSVEEMKKMKEKQNQNYFYSWDGKEINIM